MNGEHRLIPVAVEMGRAAADAVRHAVGGEPADAERQTPPIDIHDAPEGLVLEADLPGATESSLNIQLEDNVLSLQARVEPPVPADARLIHEEYRVGSFFRSFILSDEVERTRITAELKDGVLRLTLPKAERAKTRRIEIKTS
jgi:HSP20 family protein